MKKHLLLIAALLAHHVVHADVRSGHYQRSRTYSAAASIPTTSDVVLANALSAAFTLTLPSATSVADKVITIKKTDTSVNLVTVAGLGSQTIDGASTFVLQVKNDSIQVQASGGNWVIVQKSMGHGFVGAVMITGCSVNFSRQNSAYGDMTNLPTGCTYTVEGRALAPTTAIPAVRLSSVEAGEYVFVYEGLVIRTNATDANGCFFRFSDGTSHSKSENFIGINNTTQIYTPTIGGRMLFSIGQGETTFRIQARGESANATCGVYGNTNYPGIIRIYRLPLTQ